MSRARGIRPRRAAATSERSRSSLASGYRGGRPNLARLARERRELREARKRLQPPPAVPPAYLFKVGPIDLSARDSQRRDRDDDATLPGFVVSPGRVTAPVSMIRSPAESGQMQPGSILVCPTTTPARTPRFSQAHGLVTDIGGILAHGSIVAREYGIPAVTGTTIATQRITSGQQVTVNGDIGSVTLGEQRRRLSVSCGPEMCRGVRRVSPRALYDRLLQRGCRFSIPQADPRGATAELTCPKSRPR